MLASEWRGAEQIVVTPRIVRGITDAADALIRVTSTTICGSDLHMYHNQVPGVGTMKEGDILGRKRRSGSKFSATRCRACCRSFSSFLCAAAVVPQATSVSAWWTRSARA